ncbi:MAG: hypothetical protein ABSH12_05755 [Endomicrobiales bacterium]|jgi:hypothetical protein
MLYDKLFKLLNAAGVRYLMAGGVAINLYGLERMTGDVDICVDLGNENLKKLTALIKTMGYRPVAPVKIEDLLNEKLRNSWVEEKNMIAFSLHDPKNSFFSLDILIGVKIDFNKAYARREIFKSGEIEISVLSVEDIISLKEKSGRPQDKSDVHYLRKIYHDKKK